MHKVAEVREAVTTINRYYRGLIVLEVAKLTPSIVVNADFHYLYGHGSDGVPDAIRNHIEEVLVKKLSGKLDNVKSGEFTVYWTVDYLRCVEDVIQRLNAGIGTDAVNWAGWTALTFAASTGDLQTVRLLLDRGADVNHVTELGHTPLTLALTRYEESAIDIIRLLIEKGADVNYRQYPADFTPLMHSVYRSRFRPNLDAVRLLLDSGADKSIETASGESAMSLAQERGNQELIQLVS